MNKKRNKPMKSIKLLLVTLLPLLPIVVSCGLFTDDEHTYQSSDQVQMEHLMKLLARRDIPFESIDGLVRYNSDVKTEFEKALRAFDSVSTVQFNDTDVRNYFHSILFEENIEYIESDRDGGDWTLWWPGSEERRTNILDQVVEYKITLQMEEETDCESGSSDAISKPSFIQDALNNLADQ